MSILRYKKQGGFEKLVNSLELTSPDKRKKIMETLATEDPVFMDRVEKSILSFNELKSQPIEILMEIVYLLGSMQYVALALYKLEDQEFAEKIKKCIPQKQMLEYKDALDALAKVTQGQREGAQFKFVEVARKLQAEKGIKIKSYLVDENNN